MRLIDWELPLTRQQLNVRYGGYTGRGEPSGVTISGAGGPLLVRRDVADDAVPFRVTQWASATLTHVKFKHGDRTTK